MSDRLTGTVKFFNTEKGFGFIAPENGERDVFVHYSSIQSNGFRNLNEGDRVEFSMENSDKGPRAAEVVKI
ncbi:MAG TPA: cold-shock protein [Ardenticatenaceae bacterium]|jgi:CspA family cold shock protein